jgi:hypothetical protein
MADQAAIKARDELISQLRERHQVALDAAIERANADYGVAAQVDEKKAKKARRLAIEKAQDEYDDAVMEDFYKLRTPQIIAFEHKAISVYMASWNSKR